MRNRILSIFDNVAASIILSVLTIAGSFLVSVFYNLPLELTLLFVLIAGQVLGLIFLLLLLKDKVSKKQVKELLFRHAETNKIFLLDRHNLPHPIDDDDTASYLMHILGYLPNEVKVVTEDKLKPVGAVVTAKRDYRTPRTEEDEKRYEASRSFRILRKSIQSEPNRKILSFHVRWHSQYTFYINSVELRFDPDPVLTSRAISPINEPDTLGLLSCKLLFDRDGTSYTLQPQQEVSLDLIVIGPLREEDEQTISTRKIGTMTISGMYREQSVTIYHDA